MKGHKQAIRKNINPSMNAALPPHQTPIVCKILKCLRLNENDTLHAIPTFGLPNNGDYFVAIDFT